MNLRHQIKIWCSVSHYLAQPTGEVGQKSRAPHWHRREEGELCSPTAPLALQHRSMWLCSGAAWKRLLWVSRISYTHLSVADHMAHTETGHVITDSLFYIGRIPLCLARVFFALFLFFKCMQVPMALHLADGYYWSCPLGNWSLSCICY